MCTGIQFLYQEQTDLLPLSKNTDLGKIWIVDTRQEVKMLWSCTSDSL